LYIYNLVVVVNADFFVDKSFFTHRIKHLPWLTIAVKSRYPAWEIMGQILAVWQKGGFCTSRAVDIQLFVHRRIPKSALSSQIDRFRTLLRARPRWLA
jgi:hypothetical protein